MGADYIEGLRREPLPEKGSEDSMTALSCVAIGIAFLLAIGLLVFAGVLPVG